MGVSASVLQPLLLPVWVHGVGPVVARLLALGKGQKPESARDQARGRGGLGPILTAGPKREGPPKRPPHMLSISPVLVRPSIDVPRTILIGPTDAPLNSPTPRTWPSSAAVVSVIARVVPIVVVVGMRAVAVVDALRLNGSGRSDCGGPDKAESDSSFC